MLLTQAIYRDYLNINSGSADDTALAGLIGGCESAIIKWLGFNPLYANRTEFYPRGTKPGQSYGPNVDSIRGIWSSDGNTASFVSYGDYRGADLLQLRHLPLRGQPVVWEDFDGRFGSKSGSFAASDKLTYGTDFYMAVNQLDGANEEYVLDGQLIRIGSWSAEPGSVKVSYNAGWTVAEINYDATNPPASGIDAGGIGYACRLMVSKAWKTRSLANTQRVGSGSAGGVITMERAGEYMYMVDPVSARMLSGQEFLITPEVAEALQPYRHYGLLARG